MASQGGPDDADPVTSAADLPVVLRHRVGPAEDPDRYELLGEADALDESWHVLDHRAGTGDALFVLAVLRPAPGADGELWRGRAAGLTRVHHPRLACVVATFTGAAPHRPGRAGADARPWEYAVVEQASGRSVGDWLRDDPGAGTRERFTVLAAAAAVLQDLHRGSADGPPLVHGDLTPATVRLGGFWPGDGVRLAGASLGGRSAAGAPWTAPEVRAGALPSAASDVFSFGATAVLVLAGQPPALGASGDVDPALVRRQLAAAPRTAPHPRLADLLLRALDPDPARRPDQLPGWVAALRAVADPTVGVAGRPRALPLPGIAGLAVGTPVDDGPGTHRAPRATVLPAWSHRSAIVVAGALLLATGGTALAVSSVQRGDLAAVPNPAAVVQPPAAGATAPADEDPGAPSADGSTGQAAPGVPEPTSADLPAEEGEDERPDTTGAAPAPAPSAAPTPAPPAPTAAPPPLATVPAVPVPGAEVPDTTSSDPGGPSPVPSTTAPPSAVPTPPVPVPSPSAPTPTRTPPPTAPPPTTEPTPTSPPAPTPRPSTPAPTPSAPTRPTAGPDVPTPALPTPALPAPALPTR